MSAEKPMYEQVDVRFMPDDWRSICYRRRDGSEFRVASPPIRVMADYGIGRVFLDRITYDEQAHHKLALALESLDKENE